MNENVSKRGEQCLILKKVIRCLYHSVQQNGRQSSRRNQTSSSNSSINKFFSTLLRTSFLKQALFCSNSIQIHLIKRKSFPLFSFHDWTRRLMSSVNELLYDENFSLKSIFVLFHLQINHWYWSGITLEHFKVRQSLSNHRQFNCKHKNMCRSNWRFNTKFRTLFLFPLTFFIFDLRFLVEQTYVSDRSGMVRTSKELWKSDSLCCLRFRQSRRRRIS